MRYLKFTSFLCICVLILASLSLFNGAAAQSGDIQTTASATAQATLQGTAPALSCSAPASATQGATLAATMVGTQAALSATAGAIATPVIVVKEDANAPLHFVSFLPTDIRFNPNPEKPVALVMVFSLVFQNQLGEALHIESPRFKLAINGVPWGMLSSTDFQTGQMLAHAEQGIVLQNLTLFNKVTPEQQAVVPCLTAHLPVDLTLTGTIQAFPGGKEQPVAVTLTTQQVIIRERQ